MHGKTIKKLVKLVVATHKTAYGMNAITVTSETLVVFCPMHCTLYMPRLGSRQTRTRFSKKIYIFIPHAEHVSLVQFNLCRVLTYSAWRRQHHMVPGHRIFKGKLLFFFKSVFKICKNRKGSAKL